MDMKIVQSIQKTAQKLIDGTPKQVPKARNSLGKQAMKHPEEFVAAGLDPADYPRYRNDVREYGCFGKIVPLGTANTPDVEMRATHECYNMQVAATLPGVMEYRKLLEGPVQVKANNLQAKIDNLFEQLRQIRKDNDSKQVKKIDPLAVEKVEPEVEAILQKIKGLKQEKYGLKDDIHAERSALRKKHEERLKAADNAIAAGIKSARPSCGKTVTGGTDLWFGNYKQVESDINTALKKAKNDPDCSMHYRYGARDGTRPPNIVDLLTWNREGAITVDLFGSTHGQKTAASVMGVADASGKVVKNLKLKLRPLKESELETFDLPPDFMAKRDAKGNVIAGEISEKAARLHVVSLRNGDGWFETVVVLHRPLAENLEDEATKASLIRKKVGFKHRTYLCVSMKRLTDKTAGGDKTTLPDRVNAAVAGMVVAEGLFESAAPVTRERPPFISQALWNLQQTPCKGMTATITPMWETQADGSTRYCEWVVGSTRGFEVLPPDIKLGEDQAKRLDKYVKGHANAAQMALKKLGDGNDPDTAPLPHGLHAKTRGLMRRAYTEWCKLLWPTKPKQQTAFKQALKDMRELARESHGRFKVLGEENSGLYGGSYPGTLARMAHLANKLPGIEDRQAAQAFSALLMFDERFVHLHPWAVNLRDKALARRTNIYRNFASVLGRQVRAFRVPKTDYRTRFSTDAQKTVSPSELIKWLKNYADREGLKFEEYKTEKSVARVAA